MERILNHIEEGGVELTLWAYENPPQWWYILKHEVGGELISKCRYTDQFEASEAYEAKYKQLFAQLRFKPCWDSQPEIDGDTGESQVVLLLHTEAKEYRAGVFVSFAQKPTVENTQLYLTGHGDGAVDRAKFLWSPLPDATLYIASCNYKKGKDNGKI